MSKRTRSRTDAPGWRERLALVGELASLINTTNDLDEIFQAAILKLRGVLDFRRASVLLVTEDRSGYYLHTLFDGSRGGFIRQEARFPMDHGLPGDVIRSGRAMRIDTFPGARDLQGPDQGGASALIVPLRLESSVIGTLNLGAAAPKVYTDEDLELAQLLARQIETSLYYSRLLSTIRQESDRAAREHAAAESERRRLEALVEATDVALLMVSEGRVAYVNRGMAQILGLPSEVVVGGSLEQVHRALAGALADPTALDAQVTAINEGGKLQDRVLLTFPRKLTCQRTVSPVLGTDGETLGHLVLYRDVTSEAQAEAAKNEFVSIVSHELRTPLTSVKTSLDLLMRGTAGEISPEMKGLLEIGLRNLDRLIRLVNDLLDLSRIESGRMVTTMAPVIVAKVVERGLDAVRAFSDGRGVGLEVLPSSESATVVADEDRLEQVVVNLVSNAVKFSPSGGRVSVGWSGDETWTTIEVRDQGPGIPEGQLEVIFEKFRQLEDAGTRAHGGAGLGLTISRRIVEHFGGALWATSRLEEGSTFFVRLPTAARVRRTAELTAVDGAPTGLRVLVTEKDADRRYLLTARIEAEGWEVTSVPTGTAGLEAATQQENDLIVVGVELADMHGLEFVQRLRSIPACADTPVLLVGRGRQEGDLLTYGADGWVLDDIDQVLEEGRQLATRPRRPLILLVDDDPAVRRAFGRALRHAGYACLEAATGDAGLQMARERAPTLILTDWHMPGMDGMALLREVRSLPGLAGVPAIMMTGHAVPELNAGLAEVNAELLTKPADMTQVIAQVRRLAGEPPALVDTPDGET